MIPILDLSSPADRSSAEKLLNKLRLDPREFILADSPRAKAAIEVNKIIADVAQRGDDAIVDICKKFDDPNFSAEQIRVSQAEMKEAHGRVDKTELNAVKRSIAQVREYQTHILPEEHKPLKRPGVELGIRFTPLDSAGLYFPGGKASYPSSLIMLSVPAQVAGVKKVAVCTPPSKYGRSDLILATALELGLTEVFRAGGAAAIAALTFGTKTIPAVDKIVGPGNSYVQLAKRAVSGCVGIDGYLGPSEIVTIADASGNAAFIAADLLAQAEHDPGSCFLVTDSGQLASDVVAQIEIQCKFCQRLDAIARALKNDSAIMICKSLDECIDWANRFAAEHVNIQTKDNDATLKKLRHAGAVFVGPYSPVAAGDYIAGPSHCLPTNTTARFTSGISVYEFMKHSSVEKYEQEGLRADAPSIIALANAEHLDAHAASVKIRQ